MSEIRKDCLYTKDHEWVRKTANPRIVQVGITDFAQSALGDVTYVQVPPTGKALTKGSAIGSVESVKAVSDIFAPLSGTVVRVNTVLDSDPSLLNSDPYGAGWLLEIEIEGEGEFSSLLSPDAYTHVAQ